MVKISSLGSKYYNIKNYNLINIVLTIQIGTKNKNDILDRHSMRKINLDYIEFNVVDHCNMNCKGCALFAPIASENYIDLSQHSLDMARLSELFENINLIRLIGGEPFLNKDLDKVISITREAFPIADIRILTNGTMLESLEDNFWIFLKKHNIKIDVTLYPIHYSKEDIYKNISKDRNVPINIKKKYSFKLFIRRDGKGDRNKTFEECSFKVSTFLRNGYVSACHMPSMSYILNEHFGTNISDKGKINIHQKDMTANKIINFLQQPLDVCRYCIDDPDKYDWELGEIKIDEWAI